MVDRASHLQTIGQGAETGQSSQPGASDTYLCVARLRREIEAGRRALVLVGCDAASASEALDQLVDRLRESRLVVRLSGCMLLPEELALGLLVAIDGQRREVTPTAGNVERTPSSELAVAPIVAIVEGCDGLLPATAAWLSRLIQASGTSIQLVLVGRYETVLRRALPEGLREHEPILLPEPFNAPAPALEEALPSTQRVDTLPESPGSLSDGLRPDFVSGRDEPPIVVSDDVIEGPTHTRALAPVIELPPRAVVRAKEPAVALASEAPAVEPPPLFEAHADRSRFGPAMAVVGMLLLGLGVWVFLALAPLRPDEPIRQTVEGEATLLDLEPSRLRAEVIPADDAALPSARMPEQPTPDRIIVAYEPVTQHIRVSARDEPLYKLLTLIAWQTGLLFESEVDLSERVSVDRTGLTVEAMLEELLQDYHVISLGPSAGTAASGWEARTIWVLMERSIVAPVAEAVDTLLTVRDPAQLEEAARVLERQGFTSVGYALVDVLQRAQRSNTDESISIRDIARRVRDTLCNAWSTTAVGPQAGSLRCE